MVPTILSSDARFLSRTESFWSKIFWSLLELRVFEIFPNFDFRILVLSLVFLSEESVL